jgi:hypothetical protein
MVLRRNGQPLFTLGMYERPRNDDEWSAWSQAGINLVCCNERGHLDTAHKWGMFGWVPVPMILAPDDDGNALAQRIRSLADHPALAVWEAPDEAIWHAHRQPTNWATKRLWSLPPDQMDAVQKLLDVLVAGLSRGSALIRSIDPGRALWLNESGANQLTLARCVSSLDVVGFDAYPVPSRVEKPMHHVGLDLDRFRAIAPNKELWMVEQVFSWNNLDPERKKAEAPIYPTVEQSRFMAWQAILHGATGLLWWGSSFEDRPTPIVGTVMSVVSEINQLHAYLAGGEVTSVRVCADTRAYPATALGIGHICRRAGNGTLLVLANEDPFEQEAIVTGLDWLDVRTMRPICEPSAPFTRIDEGYITSMQPYEVRLYVSE